MKLGCHIITNHLRKAASTLLPLAVSACLAGSLFAQPLPSPDTAANTGQTDIADPQSAAAAKQSLAESDADGMNSIRSYQEQVNLLESQYDAYNADLSEAMLGLGLAQQQQGNHEDAILSLERALQINRVNHGLYHVNKIPLIEQLIVSYAATGDWQAVEDRYFTLMQLYARNFDINDVELLPGLAKLIKWHLYAFGAELTEQPVSHLLLARELIVQTIDIIKFNYGADDLRQLNSFGVLLLTDFYLAVTQSQYQKESPKAGINSFREESDVAQSEFWGFSQNMFTRGKHHIEEMIHITQNNAATPPRTAVDTLVLLADWNLIFKQQMTADEIYKEVWEQAMKLENHERHIGEIFTRPVNLPNINIGGTSYNSTSFSENGNDSTVQDSTRNTTKLGAIVFEFDISTTGRAMDPEVVETDPGASKNNINKARRQLKASRFRPRYENGIAVENQNARIRYRFEPDPEQTMAEASNGE